MPVNGSLFEKRVFANVIKDLEIRSLRIIWEVLNPLTSDLIREIQRDRKRGGSVIMEQGLMIGTINPRNLSNYQKPEEAKSKISLKPFRGRMALGMF